MENNKDFKIKILIVGPLLTNCYLLSSRNEAMVIDPGGEVENIFKEIKKENIKVRYIVNTHFHPDHILENKSLKRKTGAKILIHEKEKDFISFHPDKFLKGGDKIKFGDVSFLVIDTPGHTKGSLSLFGNGFLFTGDLLFADGIGRTDLLGGNEKEIKKSLNKISKFLKAGINVCPGHGDIFKVSKSGLDMNSFLKN